MRNGSETWSRAESYRRTARAIGDWYADHEDVVRGLFGLRNLGEQADVAVAAVMNVPAVRTLRLSWELFEALVEGEGLEPDEFLVRALPAGSVSVVRTALFDSDPAGHTTLTLASGGAL